MYDNTKHKHYETLNLIGYGLSKFNYAFVHAFGYTHKAQFYNYIVAIGIAETVGTVKNRQDLFDGMTRGGDRKGWWQKGAVYKHRKDYIDALFGQLHATDFAEIVKLSIIDTLELEGKHVEPIVVKASPIMRSQFKQMQMTGKEAECYFINNYRKIEKFAESDLDDARLLGDGYDFQLSEKSEYYLVEVKGIRADKGTVRMTKNEYEKALEFKERYALVVICNLEEIPRMISIFDPVNKVGFNERIIASQQLYYQSIKNKWY